MSSANFLKKMDAHEFLVALDARMQRRVRLFGRKGCLVWQLNQEGGRRQGYGKIRAKFPNDTKSKYYYVHRLAYMISHNVLEIPNVAGRTEHVSHLCHTTLCCNPQHLSLEPQVINNERQHCYAENNCFGHHWEGNIYGNCILWYIFKHILNYLSLFYINWVNV